jgi:hypothetical protein
MNELNDVNCFHWHRSIAELAYMRFEAIKCRSCIYSAFRADRGGVWMVDGLKLSIYVDRDHYDLWIGTLDGKNGKQEPCRASWNKLWDAVLLMLWFTCL